MTQWPTIITNDHNYYQQMIKKREVKDSKRIVKRAKDASQ